MCFLFWVYICCLHVCAGKDWLSVYVFQAVLQYIFLRHIFLSRFHTYSLFFSQSVTPNHPHNIPVDCAVHGGGWSFSERDLYLTFGSGGIWGVWMTRGWHLYILEDIFTPKRCWRVPRRPRPRRVWPDFSPPSFWQSSPGIHRNAFSKTHDKDFGAPCLLPLMSSEVRSCPTPLSLCLTSWLNKEICIYEYSRQRSKCLLMQTCWCSGANRWKSLEN